MSTSTLANTTAPNPNQHPRALTVDAIGSLSVDETTIRNAVRQWCGPMEMLLPAARRAELERRDDYIRTLCALHAVGEAGTAGDSMLPLCEADVFEAILVLNRLRAMIAATSDELVEHCTARVARERNPHANQLDRFQIRHLLTFFRNIPHRELTSSELAELRDACHANNHASLRSWFDRALQKRAELPRDTPQCLRRILTDLWHGGYIQCLEMFGREIALLEISLFPSLGWEMSRLFFSTMKRAHGSALPVFGEFVEKSEIDHAVAVHMRMGDEANWIHFRALATKYDAAGFTRREKIFTAATVERIASLPALAAPKVTAAHLPREPRRGAVLLHPNWARM